MRTRAPGSSTSVGLTDSGSDPNLEMDKKAEQELKQEFQFYEPIKFILYNPVISKFRGP